MTTRISEQWRLCPGLFVPLPRTCRRGTRVPPLSQDNCSLRVSWGGGETRGRKTSSSWRAGTWLRFAPVITRCWKTKSDAESQMYKRALGWRPTRPHVCEEEHSPAGAGWTELLDQTGPPGKHVLSTPLYTLPRQGLLLRLNERPDPRWENCPLRDPGCSRPPLEAAFG